MMRLEAFDHEEQLEWLGKAYELLLLLPEGGDLLELMLDVMRDQAAGFYDPGEGTYYLMDRVPPSAAPIFSVHELTHALEDQHFDLDSRLREVIGSEDALIARGAVHEGSATLLMTLYSTKAVMEGKLDLSALLALSETEEASKAKLAELPPVLVRQLLAPYVLGMSFLTRGNLFELAAGFPVESVNRAFHDSPRSSEQVLHPEKYWDDDRRDEPRAVDLREAGGLLGGAWELKSHGVLGELIVGTMVGAGTPLDQVDMGATDPGAWTNAAAAGWGGDRWELWSRGSTSVVLWTSVWDSEQDALEFSEALPRAENLSWRREGDRVAVVAGRAGKKTTKLLERMLSVVEVPATR